MISKKEFYFVRHGQTDHNILEGSCKKDHSEDISLNETGKKQASLIQSIVSVLPIKTVCTSPLKRAQETKRIITSSLQLDHYTINELGECSSQIWKEMTEMGNNSSLHGLAQQFLHQVKNGVNQALSLPGPSLIVAHGGVHWAICCLMNIDNYEWAIDNCVLVHFSVGINKKWQARRLV